MKLATIFGTFFYSLVFFVIGISIIAFVIHTIVLDDLIFLLSNIYFDLRLRFIWGIIGLLFMLFNISFIQILIGKFQREKNIAFMNPQGEVTISLAAIEGLIKRLTQDISEIKELKPSVVAKKNGIIVTLRVVLWSEINIPEITAKLQELIKSKIQDMLGIEETVTVKIHVIKIMASSNEVKTRREPEPTVPFRGY